MYGITLIARNWEAVRESLNRGGYASIRRTKRLQMSFCSLRLKEVCSSSGPRAFPIRARGARSIGSRGVPRSRAPDPRAWSEISCAMILTTQLAGRFAVVYSQRKMWLCIAIGAGIGRVELQRRGVEAR